MQMGRVADSIIDSLESVGHAAKLLACKLMVLSLQASFARSEVQVRLLNLRYTMESAKNSCSEVKAQAPRAVKQVGSAILFSGSGLCWLMHGSLADGECGSRNGGGKGAWICLLRRQWLDK